jgi:hypothetical protein
MLILYLVLALSALLLVFLIFFRPKSFGSGGQQIERRHPAKDLETESSAAFRRKDDGVGGESG